VFSPLKADLAGSGDFSLGCHVEKLGVRSGVQAQLMGDGAAS
jgi:hypothetical protein